MLALVLSAQGETDQALVHLQEAIAIGEPEGYIRVFVDEDPPMARLLYEARALVTDDDRRIKAGPLALEDVQVAVAHAARG